MHHGAGCVGNLIEKDIAQRQSALRCLLELAAIGVLREVQAGKEKLFIHPKLMQLLADDRKMTATRSPHTLKKSALSVKRSLGAPVPVGAAPSPRMPPQFSCVQRPSRRGAAPTGKE